LVEASLAQTSGVQWDRAERVHAACDRGRDRRREQGAQRPRQMATPSVFQMENGLCGGAPVGQHCPDAREGQRLGLATVAATTLRTAVIHMGQAAAVTGPFHCRHRKFATFAERPVFRHKGVAGNATGGPEKPSSKLKQHALLSAATASRLCAVTRTPTAPRCQPKLCKHAKMQTMTLSIATTPTNVRLGFDVERLFADDPDILRAMAEVDRSLIRLALARSLRERLRAGVAMARLASRFRT